MKYSYKNHFVLFLFALILIAYSACKKGDVIGEDPYAGGKEPLGVKFIGNYPEPESGKPGEIVTFNVRGLKSKEGQLEFFINGQLTEVIDVSDTTIQVKVPEKVSSGAATINLEGQVFFGPRFKVEGDASVDKSFKVVNGANSAIYDYALMPGGYLLVGSFTDFENQASTTNRIRGLAFIGQDGAFNNSLNSGQGIVGSLNSVNRLENGQYFVSGTFSSFNGRRGSWMATRLNSDGSLDTMSVNLVNSNPERPDRDADTVATFNGGVNSSVAKSFIVKVDGEERILLLGFFDQYMRNYYLRSTKDYTIIESKKMKGVARLHSDGQLDTTYNYDFDKKESYAGPNGYIMGAVMQANKAVIVGAFTSFHGKPSNRIVRLDEKGEVDPTFNVGSGADGDIFTIRSNANSGKMIITGNFKSFNGVPSQGIVLLNSDGSVDNSFKPLEFKGGTPNFAHILNNGRVVVSGSFDTYDNVTRRGFLILESDGSVLQRYNNLGEFAGNIENIIETTSSLGHPAIIIMGYVFKFDDEPVGNIVRVELKD